MIRFEGKGMVVRYDGTETRVWVERAHENDGLTLEELKALRTALDDAYQARQDFESSQPSSKGDPT